MSDYYVCDGETSTGITVGANETMHVSSGGTAIGTIINTDGNQTVFSGGVASSTVVLSSGAQNLYMGKAVGTVLSGGRQDVHASGATASGTVISSGGWQWVYYHGTASGTTILTGGSQRVGENEYWTIEDGFCTVTGTVVSSGGSQIVSAGGIANGTVISSAGSQEVNSGGIASGTVISSGGSQEVNSGGIASDTTLSSGGQLFVSEGGSAIGVIQESGGVINAVVTSGDAATKVTGTNENGSFSISGGIAENLILYSGCTVTVNSGATLDNATIYQNANVDIQSGATVTNTLYKDWTLASYKGLTLNSGERSENTCLQGALSSETVNDGSIASGTTIHTNGYYKVFQYVKSGGVAVSTCILEDPDSPDGRGQIVEDGGTAISTTLHGGSMHVQGGGVASGAAIYQGGTMLMDRYATAYNTTVHSGGSASIYGTVIGLTVFSGGDVRMEGTVSGMDISSGGSVFMLGTKAHDLVISNGGTITAGIYNHIYSAIVYNGGVMRLDCNLNDDRTWAYDTQVSGGTVHVSSGGSASGTKIYSAGQVIVSSGGSATDTTISKGGTLNILQGGTATGIVQEAGGKITLEIVPDGGNTLVTGTNAQGAFEYSLADGPVDGFHVASGVELRVASGGSATNIIQDAGANVNVTVDKDDTTTLITGTNAKGAFSYSSGVADNFIISSGWSLTVNAGGHATNLTMESGGMVIYQGVVAFDGSLLDTLVIKSGRTEIRRANGVIIPFSDQIAITGTCENDPILLGDGSAANLTFDAWNLSVAGATTTSVTLIGNTSMSVGSDGITSGTNIRDNATEWLYGGITNGTVVSSGGSQIVWDGVASGTIILNGGVQELRLKMWEYAGGITYDTIISSGGSQSVEGTANGTIILNGGSQSVVYRKGIANHTLVSSGGIQTVKHGSAFETTVYGGGIIQIEGDSYYGNGTASGTKVLNGGSCIVAASGEADNTVILAGGRQSVLEGGKTTNMIVSPGGTVTLEDGAKAGGTITLGGTMAVNGAATFNEGTSITLDVSGRNASDGYLVTGLTDLPDNVTWTLNVASNQSQGSFKLVEGFSDLGNISLSVDGTAVGVNGSAQAGGLWYALSTEDGLCLTVANSDPLFSADAMSFSTNDAKLNTAVSKTVAKGVIVTQAAIDAVNTNISYGKFSLSGDSLVFTQTKAYTHAANANSASSTYSLAVTNKFGNAATMNVTVTVADTAPTISVTALSASVPSGTAKSGKWSWSFGADIPGTKTVTVAGKTLNTGTSTNSVAVAGTYGTLTVKANGTYSYAAKANAAGTDSFAFAIKDADGDSKTAMLNVTAVDKTAPTVSKITGTSNVIGASMTFSEKMNATTLKSALKATFTGTGATMKPTAVKETDAANHVYSATFAATPYVGAYKLTLGTGAKDAAGNALAKAVTSSVSTMTVTSKSIASGAKQTVYAGGKAVKSVIKKGGTLTLNKGGIANALTLAAGGKVQVNGGSLTGTTNLKGGTLTVTAAGTKVAAVKAAKAAVISLDLRKVKAGAKSAMLVAGAKSTLKNTVSILTNKLQKLGSYKLSTAKLNVRNASFTVKAGSVLVKGLKLGGDALVKNGVSYTVSTVKKVTTLKLGVGAGDLLVNTGKAKLAGTANSDIFYGSAGNNAITGVNGRDVAVYDKNAWGKDVIARTKGTMTLLFAGLKASDITQKKSGTSLVLTRKGTNDKITVKGWKAATHSIVYANTLKEFTKYVNAASPTEKQITAARTEVWKKAGLAKA